MNIIDIHTHIIPPNLPDYTKIFNREGYVSLKKNKNEAEMEVFGQNFRTIKCNCWDPVQKIKDYEAIEVSKQVLSPIPILFYYWAPKKEAEETSKFINDYIAKVVIDYPDYFYGLGTVPLQDIDSSIKEAERCKKNGLIGLEIGSNVNGKNLSEPEFHDFFMAIEDMDMCLFVHPWQMMGMSNMKKYWLPWLVGMPAETSRAICSMIFSGVFEKFKNLRVAFAHGGGSFPFTIDRISHGYGSRPDLCAIDNPFDPKKYLGSFFVDSLVHSKEALNYLISVLGEKSLVVGSDYPFPLGEDKPGQVVYENSFLSTDIKEKILYKNARIWLGLDRNK